MCVITTATRLFAARLWTVLLRSGSNDCAADTNQLRQNDHFGVMFDTFYDRRTVLFYTNALVALADSLSSMKGIRTPRNPFCESRTGASTGVEVEMDIPSRRCATARANNHVWVIAGVPLPQTNGCT